MLRITRHQGNANRNHNAFHLTSIRMATIQKKETKNQTLLLSTSTTIGEDRKRFLRNLKLCEPNHPTHKDLPKGNEIRILVVGTLIFAAH